MNNPRILATALAALALGAVPGQLFAAPTGEQLCESAKLTAASKFAQCRLKADSTFAKSDGSGAAIVKRDDAYAKCSLSLERSYQIAEVRYPLPPPSGCPTTGDRDEVDGYLSQCTVDVSDATQFGGSVPHCGDAAIDAAGEQCDGADLGGESCGSLGFVAGTLGCSASCQFDTSGCATTLCGNGAINAPEQCDGASLGGTTCASLGYASGPLSCTAGCSFDTSACVPNPAPTCGNGVVNAGEQCDGSNLGGQTCGTRGFAGGTLRCASSVCTFDTSGCYAARFVDTGDCTVADNQTKLVWEKKVTLVGGDQNYNDPHDVDNTYSWSTGAAPFSLGPSGSAFVDFIGKLNGAETAGDCFADHCDWRLPTWQELSTIIDLSAGAPYIAPVFGPTAGFYWSSSTWPSDTAQGVLYNFYDHLLYVHGKTNTWQTRAVRVGSGSIVPPYPGLVGANFSGTNLSGHDFSCEKLNGANFFTTILTGANFYAANLTGANLSAATINTANLTGANLTNANMGAANLALAYLASVVWNATTCPDGTLSSTNGTSPQSCCGHLGAAVPVSCSP